MFNIYVRFLNIHFHIAPGRHSRFQLLYQFIVHDQPVVLTLTSRPRNHRNLQIANSMVHKMSYYRFSFDILCLAYMYKYTKIIGNCFYV